MIVALLCNQEIIPPSTSSFNIQEEFWEDPTLSISKAYESIDQEILSHSSDLGHDGSTTVTILINGRRLWIANVGDSRAVLSRKGQAFQMTTDHGPNTEQGEIETRDDFVSIGCRLKLRPGTTLQRCRLKSRPGTTPRQVSPCAHTPSPPPTHHRRC